MNKIGTTLPDEIHEICLKAAEVNACTLYGIQITDEPLTISVLVDSEKSPTIKTCENIIKQIQLTWPESLSRMLENYFLEVSSAGIDRPLFEIEHFVKSTGKTVSLAYEDNNKKIKKTGILTAVDTKNQEITISIKDSPIKIPMNALQRCHIRSDLKGAV